MVKTLCKPKYVIYDQTKLRVCTKDQSEEANLSCHYTSLLHCDCKPLIPLWRMEKIDKRNIRQAKINK